MRNAVLYKGIWLCQGSKAKELWEDLQKAKGSDKMQAQKALDMHMKLLDETDKRQKGL